MLYTGKYTWRPKNLVHFIVTNMYERFTVFSDLTGMKAQGGGTIPAALCVKNLNTDIVFEDTHTKKFHSQKHE